MRVLRRVSSAIHVFYTKNKNLHISDGVGWVFSHMFLFEQMGTLSCLYERRIEIFLDE